LIEAIALGHDLGHTPFGHIGEQVLNELSPFGFRHNEQSLRVVDLLERERKGLNLSWEVREGILKHSKTRVDILGQGWGAVDTLEGQVCKIADSVAYINHDIDDAIRANIITENDLPYSAIAILGDSHSERINTMILDIVDHSQVVMDEGKPAITIGSQVQEAANILREFLFDRVYNPNLAKKETARARQVIQLLYEYFLGHEERLPEEYALPNEPVERRVVDYIAGMSDHYALRLAEEIFPSTSQTIGVHPLRMSPWRSEGSPRFFGRYTSSE
jgi:dGTPase